MFAFKIEGTNKNHHIIVLCALHNTFFPKMILIILSGKIPSFLFVFYVTRRMWLKFFMNKQTLIFQNWLKWLWNCIFYDYWVVQQCSWYFCKTFGLIYGNWNIRKYITQTQAEKNKMQFYWKFDPIVHDFGLYRCWFIHPLKKVRSEYKTKKLKKKSVNF